MSNHPLSEEFFSQYPIWTSPATSGHFLLFYNLLPGRCGWPPSDSNLLSGRDHYKYIHIYVMHMCMYIDIYIYMQRFFILKINLKCWTKTVLKFCVCLMLTLCFLSCLWMFGCKHPADAGKQVQTYVFNRKIKLITSLSDQISSWWLEASVQWKINIFRLGAEQKIAERIHGENAHMELDRQLLVLNVTAFV